MQLWIVRDVVTQYELADVSTSQDSPVRDKNYKAVRRAKDK